MRRRLGIGQRAQITGALCMFIGLLLRWLGPQPAAGVPLDPHQFAYVILGMGACMFAGGTLARWFVRG